MKAHFFLFNIEDYGEFFSGITPFREPSIDASYQVLVLWLSGFVLEEKI
jgi:hypothetical protein